MTDAVHAVVPSAEEPVLSVRGATKTFGAVVALDGVDLEVRSGEVLALLGDNGAGKSTLIKCISGVHKLDRGEIQIDGATVHITSAADARTNGIETVYQDLALFDNLNPTANFFAGREVAGPSWLPRGLQWMKQKEMTTRTKDLLDRLQIRLPDFDADVALMSGGQRQAVAVARAVAFSSKLVILDEPTAALGLRESARVLELVDRLRTSGVAVILISHSMDHVMAVADRAMVMRGGRKIGEAAGNCGQPRTTRVLDRRGSREHHRLKLHPGRTTRAADLTRRSNTHVDSTESVGRARSGGLAHHRVQQQRRRELGAVRGVEAGPPTRSSRSLFSPRPRADSGMP